MERIDLLESKVTEMIGMVQRLHTENESLRAQLAQANDRASTVSEEREVLDQERCLVRDRIEALLGDIENITTTAVAVAETDIHLAPAETVDTTHPLDSAQTAAAAWGATTAPAHTPETAPTSFTSTEHEQPHTSDNADADQPVNPVLPGMS